MTGDKYKILCNHKKSDKTVPNKQDTINEAQTVPLGTCNISHFAQESMNKIGSPNIALNNPKNPVESNSNDEKVMFTQKNSSVYIFFRTA